MPYKLRMSKTNLQITPTKKHESALTSFHKYAQRHGAWVASPMFFVFKRIVGNVCFHSFTNSIMRLSSWFPPNILSSTLCKKSPVKHLLWKARWLSCPGMRQNSSVESLHQRRISFLDFRNLSIYTCRNSLFSRLCATAFL